MDAKKQSQIDGGKFLREAFSKQQALLAAKLQLYNRAQPKGVQDKLTRTDQDKSMVELKTKITEAVQKLKLIEDANCTKKAARDAWEWVFQTEGFFRSFDDKDDEDGGQNKSIAPTTPTSPFIKTETRFG